MGCWGGDWGEVRVERRQGLEVREGVRTRRGVKWGR